MNDALFKRARITQVFNSDGL